MKNLLKYFISILLISLLFIKTSVNASDSDSREKIKIAGSATRNNGMTVTVFNCSPITVTVLIPHWSVVYYDGEYATEWNAKPFDVEPYHCIDVDDLAGKFGIEDSTRHEGYIKLGNNKITIYGRGYDPNKYSCDDIWWNFSATGCKQLYNHKYNEAHLTYLMDNGLIVDFYNKSRDASVENTVSLANSNQKAQPKIEKVPKIEVKQTGTPQTVEWKYLTELYIVIGESFPDYHEDDPSY